MYAKGMDEEDTATWLDEVLAEVGSPKPKQKAAVTA
jgi:hypothetical protein